MSDTIKIKVKVKTDKIGSETTFETEWDAEQWNELSDTEKDHSIWDEVCQSSCLLWDYEIIEDC